MFIGAVNIDEIDANQIKILKSKVCHKTLYKISKFKNNQDIIRALVSDFFSRYLLNKIYKIDYFNKDYDFNKYGKPFIFSSQNICFNISHSSNWVICGIDNSPVGVDIEFIQPIDWRIATQFCHKYEIKHLTNLNESDRLQEFYKLWTLKESYSKCIGTGLILPPDSICSYFSNSKSYYSFSNFTPPLFSKSLLFDNKYYISIHSRAPLDSFVIKKYNLADILT